MTTPTGPSGALPPDALPDALPDAPHAGLPVTPPDAPRDVLAEVFDAVLLDMDGTLISSTRSVERCWLRLAQEYGMPTADLSPFRFHGVPARDIVDLLLPEAPPEVRAAALDRVVELEVSDTDGIEVLPGAAEALELLGAAGRCALVTSCSDRLAAARAAAVGLAVPRAVVTADDVARGKPDPEPYLAGAALLGADPRRCLVVEDAASGVVSGRAAGAATLGLRTTEDDGPAGADLLVADLAAVRFTVEEDGVRVQLR